MNPFHVGQRVVCVDASGLSDSGDTIHEGRIYTISWVGWFENPYLGIKGVCVHLEEVKRSPPSMGSTPMDDKAYPYFASRFRPVKDTSIEIFRSLLSSIPEGVA